MEMSVRELKAKASAAIAAAERGETVTITKFGKIVAELNPPKAKKNQINLQAGEDYLKSKGWVPGSADLWPQELDDPAFSREVLGLVP
jgi:antitoxin (DNA-binding transcriptional repressor) of toxin-antitoxin stability system